MRSRQVDTLRAELVEDGAVRALLRLLNAPEDAPALALPALLPAAPAATRTSEPRPAPQPPAQPVLEVSERLRRATGRWGGWGIDAVSSSVTGAGGSTEGKGERGV